MTRRELVNHRCIITSWSVLWRFLIAVLTVKVKSLGNIFQMSHTTGGIIIAAPGDKPYYYYYYYYYCYDDYYCYNVIFFCSGYIAQYLTFVILCVCQICVLVCVRE